MDACAACRSASESLVLTDTLELTVSALARLLLTAGPEAGWEFKAGGTSSGAEAVRRGVLAGESTTADWPAPTSISATALRTAIRPSTTATRNPSRGPGKHAGSQTVCSAEYKVPRMPTVAVGV